MTGRDLALNPTYDMNAAAGSERSVQAPLPSRVIATVTLDNVTFQYLDLSAWGGAYVRVIAPEDIYYLCTQTDPGVPVPDPAAVSGEQCVDRLPANTPDFFIVHEDRPFLAVRNVSAAGPSELRVSRR